VADRQSAPASSTARDQPLRNSAGVEFITLARVVKTQGRHGEVAVEVHSDVPDRFAPGMRLFALKNRNDARQSAQPRADAGRTERKTEAKQEAQEPEREAERQELAVEGLWPHKGLLVVKFLGIDSMSDAETLIGMELQVPRSQRAELEQGWNFVSDLVGCEVFDGDRPIGRIRDVQFGAGEAPLLIVADRSGKTFDVPFAEAYLASVDVRQKHLRMHLPAGMLEINAPMTAEEKREQKSGRKSR
jgi:16S rRNA processing protein RimM